MRLIRQVDQRPRKVPLELATNGTITIQDEKIKPSKPVVIVLSEEPVDSGDEFLRCKTSRRAVLEQALAAHPEARDVLLWNEHRELTETCHANIVLEIERRKLTSSRSSGLLPGVLRAHLLDCGEIEEVILPDNLLEEVTTMFLINSVRR